MQDRHPKEFEKTTQLMAAADTVNERTQRSQHFGDDRSLVYNALGLIANHRTTEVFERNEVDERREEIQLQEEIERKELYSGEDDVTFPKMQTVQGVATVTGLSRPEDLIQGLNGNSDPKDQEEGAADDFEVVRVEEHATAGTPLSDVCMDNVLFFRTRNPFFPFETAFDWKIGSWLLKGNASNEMITTGGNSGILHQQGSSYRTTITSVRELRKRVDALEPDFGKDKWLSDSVRFWANKKKQKAKFYYRNIVTVLEHYFKQPAFRDHLVYKPRKEFNEKGERVYSEIFSADWAWEKQASR